VGAQRQQLQPQVNNTARPRPDLVTGLTIVLRRRSAATQASWSAGRRVMTVGGVAAVQAFTADCRACGHKMSLYERCDSPQGNSYATPMVVQQPAQAPVPPAPVAPRPLPVYAGWYRYDGLP
jgi:hypothetical protein